MHGARVKEGIFKIHTCVHFAYLPALEDGRGHLQRQYMDQPQEMFS